MEWCQPHLNFPAKMTYHFSQKRPFSLSNLAQTEVLHIWKCPKSIILDLRYFEMCHFKKVSCTFWWENSNVVEITRKNLTFEKNLHVLTKSTVVDIVHMSNLNNWPILVALNLLKLKFCLFKIGKKSIFDNFENYLLLGLLYHSLFF